MIKRLLLGLTFLAAFGLVGVATPDTSDARRYWRRPFIGRHYAPRRYFYDRPYYYGPPYYGSYYYGDPGYYANPRYYRGPRRGAYYRWGW